MKYKNNSLQRRYPVTEQGVCKLLLCEKSEWVPDPLAWIPGGPTDEDIMDYVQWRILLNKVLLQLTPEQRKKFNSY